MELERLQQHWTAFGEQDPLWAILTFPDKRGGGWGLEEFFATGRADVDDVLRDLAERGVAIETGSALDFGCGVGRLTQALAEHFERCDGVDLAGSMIERAQELNTHGERVRFHHNDAPDLRMFGDGSFDFILALIVFQHMEPELMRGYMREFLRVLRPGGVAVFNIPEKFVVSEALPPQAWRASLTLIGPIPQLAPGRGASLRIKVRNESTVSWLAAAQLRVGNHWRASDGTLVVLDDARTLIESTVDPGGECELQLDVVAPSQPGDYQLEVDLVQELVAWFADRGSKTLKLPVTVPARLGEPVAARAAAAPPHPGGSRSSGFSPEMEMHTMTREEVVATLEEAGGVVLDLIAKDQCGPAFPNFVYIVARAITPAQARSEVPPDNAQAALEARIRRVLEDRSQAPVARARQLLATDPQRPDSHRRTLRLLDDRADLVGFALTSSLKGFGRASSAARGVLRRAMFQVLHRQTEHNQASDQLMRSHEAELQALSATIRAQLDIQAAGDERLEAIERRLAQVEVTSVALARRSGHGAVGAGVRHVDTMSFAERFRGTVAELREAQRRYLPRFEGLSNVVDAGCGRGEFLELLRDAGISALGIDNDNTMIDLCRKRDLNAIQDDILQFLRRCPEQSLGGLFAAHLVEELDRGEVVEFVRLAFSRLRPGGTLVLETVNPMCLLTYASFYGDFTRVRPLPPLALQWLAESCGFAPAEIEYSSPVAAEQKLRPLLTSASDKVELDAFNRGLEHANELLYGFQEYALVAHRPT